MDIIEKIISESESKIKSELTKVKKQIDFNPHDESVSILKDLEAYLKNKNTTIDEYENLKKRKAKNDKDIKRVMADDYFDKLFERQKTLEKQLIKIELLKMRL